MTPRPAHLARVSAASETEERAWVERIRAGDQSAFEQLVKSYYESLHSFILTYVKRREIAEELLQDLLFRLWQSREAWVVRTSVRAYLYVAARNGALLHCRHERMVDRWSHVALDRGETWGMGRAPRGGEANANAAAVREAVTQALSQLPERCKLAAVLRLQHELTYAETAEVMGISVKAVEGLYTRALKTLRKVLAPHV